MLRLLIKQIASLGHALNMPSLTAIAWRLALKEMREISQKGRATRKLIVLAKSGGMDDVKAAFSTVRADFKIYALPRSLVKQSCHHFLNNRVSDSQYLTADEQTEKLKLAYRAYLLRVLKCYRAFFGCEAILQFNVAYYAERELAAASSAAGIPFVCIYKECLRSAAFWEETQIWYRKQVGSFHGWKIAVYNDQARQAIINSGIAASWQVEEVGCARLDYSHKLRNASKADALSRKTVLFFMIQDTAGLPYFGGIFKKDGIHIREKEGMYLTWQLLATVTNDVMLKFARKNPDIDFIFKGKTGHSKVQCKRLGESLPNNVTVISDGTGAHLLEKANVVVGFQTTAVLEAIAAGRPTIIPTLLSAGESYLEPYIHDLEGAAVVVKCSDELEQALVNTVQNPQITTELTTTQKRVLRKFLGNDDGLSGNRLRKFIEDAVHADFKDKSVQSAQELETGRVSQHGS